MSIKQNFQNDCQNIFDRNKKLLETQIDISDKTKQLNLNDFNIFNKMFELHQKDIGHQFIYYLEQTDSYLENQTLETVLMPIAQIYILTFLSQIHLPEVE